MEQTRAARRGRWRRGPGARLWAQSRRAARSRSWSRYAALFKTAPAGVRRPDSSAPASRGREANEVPSLQLLVRQPRKSPANGAGPIPGIGTIAGTAVASAVGFGAPRRLRAGSQREREDGGGTMQLFVRSPDVADAP